MYDELVTALRQCADASCNGCKNELVQIGCRGKLQREAAAALEELNSQLDDFKRLCLPLKENRLYKYSDGSLVEVFLILPSEPPKEETCDTCRHFPPSSCDGKPCTQCDTSNVYTNCYEPKEET